MNMSTFRTIWTTEDRYVEVIDQRVLPHELVNVKLMNYRDADIAIRSMTVRGAPLI
jgi:methylthioribose-1-phosphate isomerase